MQHTKLYGVRGHVVYGKALALEVVLVIVFPLGGGFPCFCVLRECTSIAAHKLRQVAEIEPKRDDRVSPKNSAMGRGLGML